MRLKSVTMSGFRGFAQPVTIDLDAAAVIVSGPNGCGKTSMFDAVLWALTGSVPRLSGDAVDVVSRYSPTGEARVELELQRNGTSMRVVRRFNGAMHLSLDDGEHDAVMGATAETSLIDFLWPDARGAAEPADALSRSLTRATYLQQDVVREFVETDDEQKRFGVVSELVGVGRVTELQRQLESSRTAWTRATNALERDLDPLRSQMAVLEDRLRRLTASDAAALDESALDRWVADVERLVEGAKTTGVRRGTSEDLDRVLTILPTRQRQEERATENIERLLAHLRSPVPEAVDAEPLRAQVHASEAIVTEASEQLLLAQEAIAGERRRQAELRDQAESMRALAQLALRHLGGHCPVCDQTYDEAATRARLQELIGSAVEPEGQLSADVVQTTAAQHEAAQRQLAVDQAALRTAEQSEVARAQWDLTRTSLASDAGLDVSPILADDAEDRLAGAREIVAKLQQLRSSGEQFSLQLVRRAEQAQRSEVEEQLSTLREDLRSREAERDARSKTGELANSLLTGLRGASTKIVTEELVRIGPLLQRIYATVEPHPSFRAVRFLTRISRGHGRVWTTVVDEAAQKTVDEPSIVLSSSQLNVLAVCTFLSLNLAIETLPLQVVALDDPLQSLDTVNLLGLADLLRRVRASRQVIVSTHDSRLSDLLSRKLRPVAEGDRTRMVRFDAWTRSGPVVEQFDVPPDMVPLKLVASA
jgi:DNA repair exonuclease SbcCD ATPase subunit